MTPEEKDRLVKQFMETDKYDRAFLMCILTNNPSQERVVEIKEALSKTLADWLDGHKDDVQRWGIENTIAVTMAIVGLCGSSLGATPKSVRDRLLDAMLSQIKEAGAETDAGLATNDFIKRLNKAASGA